MPWADQVDAGPAREHVRRLLAEGMSIAQIQYASGVNRTALRILIGDFPNRKMSVQIRVGTHNAIARTRLNRGVTIDGMVSNVGTKRRLQALATMGWTRVEIARMLGLRSPTTQFGRSGEVRAFVAQQVMALYDELSTKPGPSNRIREYARGKGWLGPHWWDDDTIDDPLWTPEGTQSYRGEELIDDVTLPREQRVELMTRRGIAPGEIAERLGTETKYVLRDLRGGDRK